MGKLTGKVEKLKLDQITLDPRLQCRASIDMATVDDYAEIVKAGEPFDGPPPRVYWDKATGVKWLADGWHRYHAHGKGGKRQMDCYVVEGTYLDALRFAVQANATHGRQRTAEDKRRAVVACLDDADLAELSTREIADLCRVSRDLVERVRGVHQKVQSDTRVGRDGHRYQRTKPQPKAESEPQPLPPDPEPDDLPPEFGEPVGQVADRPPEAGGPVDAKGRPIPDNLSEAFADATFLRAKVQALGQLQTDLERFRQERPGGAFLPVQSAAVAVQNLQAAISSSRPYVVCPCCSGTLREAGLDGAPECKVCRADGKPTGFLPAGKYQALSKELKDVAESFKKGDAWEGDPA